MIGVSLLNNAQFAKAPHTRSRKHRPGPRFCYPTTAHHLQQAERRTERPISPNVSGGRVDRREVA
jgi:hypothetical protein